MNKLPIPLYQWSSFLPLLAVVLFAITCQVPVKTKLAPIVTVMVDQSLLPDSVIYNYRVSNNSKKEIVCIRVGYDHNTDRSELTSLPIGWDSFSGDNKGSISSPIGWKGVVVTQEESANHWMEWRILTSGDEGLLPGHTLEGLSVHVSKPDSLYKNKHFEVIFRDSTRSQGDIGN